MELYEVGCMIAALQSDHHIITIKVPSGNSDA
jgi:hypothetical protein